MFGYLYTPPEEFQQQVQQLAQQEHDYFVIWPVPPNLQMSSSPTPASVINLSRKQRYRVPKAAMMDAFVNPEMIQYSSGVLSGWNNDADQQKVQVPQFSSDSQEEREFTNYLITFSAWDTDSENQLLQLQFTPDRDVIDSSVERTSVVIFDYTWNNDAEQSFVQLNYQLDRDIVDSEVEKITIPNYAFNLDIENQIPQREYYKDHLSDENIELIQVNAGVGREWDNDAENQFLQPGWYIDYWEERDGNYVIPTIYPFIIGTGTVVSAVSVVGVVTPIQVSGEVQAEINALGQVAATQGSGSITPLINAGGSILSAEGEDY